MHRDENAPTEIEYSQLLSLSAQASATERYGTRGGVADGYSLVAVITSDLATGTASHAAEATAAADAVDMTWIQVIVLSIVQGLTEFLPVSSSGHLRIFSEFFWGADAGASFTAVIQLGTEIAVVIFFWREIVQIVRGWLRGLVDKSSRGADWKMGWMIIVGSIPIGVIGYLAKDFIRDSLRNLWITAAVLILFSFVFIAAERWGKKTRGSGELNFRDAIIMGLAQCLALIPGVSRSGGTISAGLFLNLDREVATRFSFLLAIPAVMASGLFSLPDAFGPSSGQTASGVQLAVGTLVAGLVGYAAIAWLLKFVANHSFAWFAAYRIPLGLLVMLLLGLGVLQPV